MTQKTHSLLHGFAPPSKAESDFVNIVRGEGCLLWDDQDNQYIDAMANLWLCQIGHGRTEIIEAVTKQMKTLEAYNVFDPFTNGPAAQLAEMVAERSPHPDGRVFLGCSGSEAVDTALKLSRLYQQLRGENEKQIIIRRTNGYHGTNFGGTSAQGIAPNREGWGDLVPHFMEVPNNDLEAAATIFANHGSQVAAIIVEPIQGAGGVYPPSDGYLEGLRKLCDDYGALLIFDEVICGFGRTGRWFGAQHFGVTPDLMTFAKGVTSGYLPLSGVIVSRNVCDTLEEPDFVLRTGYTYSGHPTSCAAGIANLELMERESLVDRANHVGEQIQNGLKSLQSDNLIESWRGTGAVYAVEIEQDPMQIRNEIRSKGVILRPLNTGLAICPPLTISDKEIGQVIDTMAEVLK
ncbi:MAG: aspartate aminotransferase family protein [Dehalococcoidia bacterium]|nr:aspartate aminotransferase family protein [Dehalococcoidia bacterium]|tara:strand:+ start:457 stop:1671 length:1215 start_codon:yes stop_codon:yes gene_type:complete